MAKGYHLIFPEIIHNDLIARLSISEDQIIAVLCCVVHQFNEYLQEEYPGAIAEVLPISHHTPDSKYPCIGIHAPHIKGVTHEIEEDWEKACDDIYLNTSIGELMSFFTSFRIVINQSIARYRV